MPPKLETLDDLLAQAEHFANFSMRNMGRVPPTVFLISPDGPVMFMPESMEDAAAKDDFATSARLLCIAHGATACVMALETWVKFARPDEELDMSEPPSEAFDRQEFVVLMGEGLGVLKQKLLPIIRSGNGIFFGFGEPNIPGAEAMTGRFAQMLPPKAPTAEDRALAQAVLKAKGARLEKSGDAPRLPPTRRS